MLALPPLPERAVVLVLPGFPIETAAAYEWLAASRPTDIPSPRMVSVPELTSWETLQPHVVNDFEPVVGERHPEIPAIIAQLREAGASIAGMTGSGSAVFGDRSAVLRYRAARKRAAGARACHPDGHARGGGGARGVSVTRRDCDSPWIEQPLATPVA